MAHLTTKARTGRANSNGRNADDLERLLAELRALWEAATNAELAQRSRLQGKIVQAIEKLKRQIGEELTPEHLGRTSYPLFRGKLPDETKAIAVLPPASHEAPLPRRAHPPAL